MRCPADPRIADSAGYMATCWEEVARTDEVEPGEDDMDKTLFGGDPRGPEQGVPC